MAPSRDHIGNSPGQATTVRALWDFLSTGPGELQFRKGDVISVTRYTHEGWWEGRLQGRTGLFPSTYVETFFSTAGPPQRLQQFSAVVHPPRSQVSMDAPEEISSRWSNPDQGQSYHP
jgi:hypothetical protein